MDKDCINCLKTHTKNQTTKQAIRDPRQRAVLLEDEEGAIFQPFNTMKVSLGANSSLHLLVHLRRTKLLPMKLQLCSPSAQSLYG